MSAIEGIERLTLETFSRLYEQEGPFEFIDGKSRPLLPPVALHGLIIRALFRLLDSFCQAHNLGEVITEMPFVLTYDANWVSGARVPDLMFFAADRWARYTANTEDWAGKPFVLIPDLAVEVVSPNDLYTEIQAKVERYLLDGVRLIWVIDPQRKRVITYDSKRYTTLASDAVLTGETIIPGLTIELEALFALEQG